MESFATPYPLYFQDDDGETKSLGVIGVHSVLTFKRFQALISQKTNLLPNQFSAVFVCRKTVRRGAGRTRPRATGRLAQRINPTAPPLGLPIARLTRCTAMV